MTDKELFEMLKENDNYHVGVDNDYVWVEDKNGKFVESFNKYGFHLLVEIFNFIGIEADYC